MSISIKNIFQLLKIAWKAWIDKDPFRESAVIAYYAIFSLPGLLIVIITLAGYSFGTENVQTHLHEQIVSTMGTEIAEQIQKMLESSSNAETSLFATIIGILTILIGATGVFAQFQAAINRIWGVTADTTKSGILIYLKTRIFSFGIIVSIAFMLMVSLVISAMITALSTFLTRQFSDGMLVFMQFFNELMSLGILSFMFAMMFKIIPDAKIKWKHVWIGSVLTAFLFEIGKFALGYYFGAAHPGTGYGAAGSVILILLWVSYSSMIVFYGAEFTRAYAEMFSGKVAPSAIAREDIQIPAKELDDKAKV